MFVSLFITYACVGMHARVLCFLTPVTQGSWLNPVLPNFTEHSSCPNSTLLSAPVMAMFQRSGLTGYRSPSQSPVSLGGCCRVVGDTQGTFNGCCRGVTLTWNEPPPSARSLSLLLSCSLCLCPFLSFHLKIFATRLNTLAPLGGLKENPSII